MIVRLATETEVAFNAVERVQHYIKTPPEAPERKDDGKAPSGWPQKGEIELDNVTMRSVDVVFLCVST